MNSPLKVIDYPKRNEIPFSQERHYKVTSVGHYLCLWSFAWLSLALGTESAMGQSPTPSNLVAKIALFSGDTLQGKLLSADANKVTLQTANGSTENSASDIRLLSINNKPVSPKPPVEVTMLDGSKAYADKLFGKSSGYQLQYSGGEEIAIPSKVIQAARLKAIPSELEQPWLNAIKETKDADSVIVARPGNQLDRINGIIVEVREADVVFELDGQQINIPIAKLLGLVWFQRGLDRVKPFVEITTTDHSIWLAESFEWNRDKMELQTSVGMKVSLPIAKLMGINYGSANIRWLSELETIEAVADKQIEFKTPVPSLELAMAPRFVVSTKGLLTTAQAADKDLYFPSPGRFVFRVPEGFSSLQGSVQRTDQGNVRSDLIIEVWQEESRLAQVPLATDQDSIEINVNVPAGKKIKLAVVCVSKLMIGTEVQWKQPRLKR